MNFPHEMMLGDVYFSPVLPVLTFAFLLAGITAIICNKLKLSRFIYAPSYVFVSIFILYTIAIDTYWIQF